MAAVPAHATLPTSHTEAPVFSGASRRGRWLRRAGLAAAAIVVLWLIALIAGVLGFDGVPGLSLPALRDQPAAVLHRDPEALPTVGRLRASSAGGSGDAVVAAGRRSSVAGSAAPPVASRALGPRTERRPAAPPRRPGGSRSTGSTPPSRAGVPPAPTAPVATSPGDSGLGAPRSPPGQSKSHRADAPGQQRAPADPGPRSPRARGNR